MLVVEDDPTIAEFLRILLGDSGCRILTAETGREAAEILRSERPDVVTLDLSLPDMDGLELLRDVQSEPDLPPPRVIVVTARPFAPRPDDCITAVLTKPFDATELERLVRDALASAARRTDADQA